ncbi:hypothetical protein AKJ53_00985 [candidate division MSBL1 archaeon SCGC-AAA382F02]|uniref:tRNA (guanine(37)-N(1))-methyltransferase n=1 Tax=candidate division MSBL1 archaeon SCGC-AAA382F02 TaxID=1698282 RepID=A0A133VIF8_9EURY|nr:hypothetical protein AKJ53_00985 [candidate division MSBL1 archaeon SCGC-AAA382F02]
MSEPRNLQEALADELSEEELQQVGTSFDIVGDIAVIKLADSLLEKKEKIGKALMEVHGHLSTVLMQTSPVKGEYRTRDLEVIAGKEKTETTHKEHGCSFKVDLSKVYFSPRLAHERFRIAQQVESGEVVTNMFAGVGCYSILMARHADPEKVYSIDKNSDAVEYMRDNIRINKVSDVVIPIEGDARNVIEEHLQEKSDRILMPLPEFARDFFDAALQSLKPKGGIIHFYDYGEEPQLFQPSFNFVQNNSSSREVDLLEKRVVRSYGPNLYHVVLDLDLGPK